MDFRLQEPLLPHRIERIRLHLTATDRRFACHDLADEFLLVFDQLPGISIKCSFCNITEYFYLAVSGFPALKYVLPAVQYRMDATVRRGGAVRSDDPVRLFRHHFRSRAIRKRTCPLRL